ncbi:DUF7594 domain-containing protein [Hyalangium rubrum]|uniref:DNRLRE domain-containing protein n=1 Tax=Hyalangium rubrum TaxID=3103134 RepID=A0ABU5GV57_9BACT|nr:DNRLRE domain-containing protein [Hyalangium sp. s54d21]MDY7225062.1 DNRLRE domain-containing protein [Hyalangium sp. s54d21]
MNRGRVLGRGLMGLVALAMLAHCGGGGEADEQALTGVVEEEAQGLATTLTFGASADARVEASAPTQNLGSSSTLLADLSPQGESYLRFSVSGVSGAVTRATLRLYASDGTTDGPRVFLTSGSWSESGLTWNNRPALPASPLSDVGEIASGTWVEYDVTSAVSGNGEFHFALVPASSNGATFYSRESSQTALRPQLVVTLGTAMPASCLPRQERYPRTYSPLADTFVSQSEPDRSFGLDPALRVDGEPRMEAYLRYFVLNEGLSIADARLVLHASDSTSNGPALYRTQSGWSESMTWNTRPLLSGAPIGNLGAISAGSQVTYDLRSVVTSEGAYSFGLIPESGDGVVFSSLQDFEYSRGPKLEFTLQTDPYCSYRGSGGGLTHFLKRYGGGGFERLDAMASDASGGFVAAGLFGSASFPESEGFALARYTAEGQPQWTRVVATDDVRVRALAITPEGNILAAGNYEGTPDLGTGPLPAVPDGWDYAPGLFIAKFSPAGATVWVRAFSPRLADGSYRPVYPEAIATDAQGSLVLVGSFEGRMDLGGGPLVANPDNPSPPIFSTEAGFLAKFSWQGQHLWSRAFSTDNESHIARLSTVSTDAQGQIFVGGMAAARSNLGDGPLGERAAFVAKYSAAGGLLWKRVFSGARAWRMNVRAVGTSAVAFSGDLRGSFTFGGVTYHSEDSHTPESPFLDFAGTLSATGADAWIRPLPQIDLFQLSVGPEGAVTLIGSALGTFDLGGSTLGSPQTIGSLPFVVRYSATGAHLWSRTLDQDFAGPLLPVPTPDGGLVLGGTHVQPIEMDGYTLTSAGDMDLLYLRLQP